MQMPLGAIRKVRTHKNGKFWAPPPPPPPRQLHLYAPVRFQIPSPPSYVPTFNTESYPY